MPCGDMLIQELRQLGYRVTPQRAVILETVAHEAGHSSAQEVFDKARQRLPGLNLATVYRTLEALNEAGLVDLFTTGTGLVRFSLKDPHHPHGHLVCQQCGQILEFDVHTLTDFERLVGEQYGFNIDLRHPAFSGTCQHCRSGE